MEQTGSELQSVTAGLSRANARLADALDALASRSRTDLTGLPPGGAALLLARAAARDLAPMVVVTPDVDTARRTAEDLQFFLGPGAGQEGHEGGRASGDVLVYPPSDTSPFLDVAPDRRAAMDRLGVLFHLSYGLDWRFLVLPAAALLRRVPPRSAIQRRCRVVEAEGELDRDDLVQVLIEGGYLRVPVAEDPGTFAVRGGIIDVYPPHARYPARIELDDWLVLSIKLFDPDDQRTVRDVHRVLIHPARDALLGHEELGRAREHIRALCDEVNLPTTKTRQVLDDLDSGRLFFGLDGLLPAFYEQLETVLDYVSPNTPIVLQDPTGVTRAVDEELERARNDRGTRVEEGSPVFPLKSHYMDEAETATALERRRLAIVHRVAVGGEPEAEDEGPLAPLESLDHDSVFHLGGEDQQALAAELRAHRARGPRREGGAGQGTATEDALEPVATRVRSWLDAGMHVVLAARNQSQAERLGTLLRGHDVPVTKPEALDAATLEQRPSARAHIAVGPLADGFVLASDGIACVTEEEIFGSRAHRRSSQRRRERNRRKLAPAVEDLRELEPGDYVVHVDHGVGRYRGLERKGLAQTAQERMRGDNPRAVEVLVVEYAGGDKLFLPVTRLNQIQKFSGKEGQTPKVDKLGGQTFAKTKARVRKEVRKLADELLQLYAQRRASHRDALPPADRAYAEFEATFPFEETPDQARAIDEVLGDLERAEPMDRLVCGDVGFGKTEVALRAAFRVAMNGKQVVMLCPTTVLAQQHYLTFKERFADYPIRVDVLSRFVDKKKQSELLSSLKDGTADVVVGTHRLLSKDVHFDDLGLLIVDEEQRFGVAHKERIKRLRTEVDVLTLSATPIPRTLQMAIGGLRDLSLIATPPVDRRAVRTLACRWDDQVIRDAIRRELSRGGQAFFVYNRVEGLYERANRVQELVPEARVAVAHGQMKETTLERVMTDFVDGHYDVLASTAIVESGLDIPRANTILIDRADMFGLAQLYQLRGRVGRSRERAYCYLITPPPSKLSDEARYRIEALERFTELGSGFHVASLDMELRGAGDLLGVEQSGNMAAVGFDLFVQMLEEAVAQLRGEPVEHEVDPELTLDLDHHIPEDYIEDVGLRLSFYKRFAAAEDEQAVQELANEMEDRFGPPPAPAVQLVRAMGLKPGLRKLRALGCEATSERVTLHLREDTPLDPTQVTGQVQQRNSPWSLSPDMKLTRRFELEEGVDTVDRVHQTVQALLPLCKDPPQPETRSDSENQSDSEERTGNG